MIQHVPLYGHDGNVRGEAVVDDDVFETINAHRWLLSSTGYATRFRGPKDNREALAMHREIMGLPAYGRPKVRHLNGDPLDNRRANLAVSRRWIAEVAFSDPITVQRLLSSVGAASIAA